EVGGVALHGHGPLPQFGEAEAAHVVGQQRELADQAHDHVAPDAEIGAERVDEDQRRALGRGRNDLIMQYGIAALMELHRPLSALGGIRRWTWSTRESG